MSRIEYCVCPIPTHSRIKLACNMVMVLFWFIPSVPLAFPAAGAIPLAAITSSMACRVHRKLKLGLLDQEDQQRVPRLTANIMLTTCVQVPPLTDVLTTKDIEAGTSSFLKPIQIVESDMKSHQPHTIDSV